MDSTLVNILINVGCSIITTLILSIFIYFRFLKHIPEETKKQIDELLNSRLGYETINHNASIQKSDSVQNILSREHSEIKKEINFTNKEITSLSGKIDFEKERKEMQYNFLKDNDKDIINYLNKLSALGEALKRTNYDNLQLKAEVSKLNQEKTYLEKQLSHYQRQECSHNNDLTL